ncbi:hypothetical protein ACS0TY_021810 [Phlomoides rotata]
MNLLIGYIFLFISGMDPFGNQMGQDVDRVKFARGRRSWSKIEEDALIISLTNMVLEGWKSNNGFKVGFQRELEKGMRKIILGTDIVANPHIKSNIHWIEIFGKDRATGENAVDPIDLANELYRTGLDQEGDTGDKYVPLTPDCMNDMEDEVTIKPTDLNPKTMPKGKKRKTNDSDITMLVDSLGEFMKFSKNAMTDLCTGAKIGVGSSNDNKQLNVIMKGIVGLKVSDKLKVCDELVQNSKCLEFFLSLPLEELEEYVWMLLDGRL